MDNVSRDAPEFYITASPDDPTLFRFSHKEQSFLKPLNIADTNTKNVIATHYADSFHFGVKHLPNFDLPGRWVSDEEWEAFQYFARSTIREVVKYVAIKEEKKKEEAGQVVREGPVEEADKKSHTTYTKPPQ